GYNTGTIDQTYATGIVMGGSNAAIGGFVGLNLTLDLNQAGIITHSYATGAVDGGSSNNMVAAAFAAINVGKLVQTYGTGLVTGGNNSTLGGLVGVNQVTFVPPSMGNAPISNALVSVEAAAPVAQTFTGTATDSYWDRQTTGQITSAGGIGVDTVTLVG